jgi:hypothetical protein
MLGSAVRCHASYLLEITVPLGPPPPSEQEEIVTQRYRHRAWSLLIVVGSILAAAAIWSLPEYEARAR